MLNHISSESEYIRRFHETIDHTDKETISFSSGSIAFWKSFYVWDKKPVMYIEEDGEIASVLFYNLTQNDKYVSIINIVTKSKFRGRGHAFKLMQEAVRLGYERGMSRLRLNCDNKENTIKFYNRLGLLYWGITKSDALYCNLPLLSGDINDFHKYKDMTCKELLCEKSIRLTARRLSPDMSADLYVSIPKHVDPERYRHNEFLRFGGECLSDKFRAP